MLSIMIAIALQSEPLLEDRAFLEAHAAWVACTNRAVDADSASARNAEEITASALAACATEEAAVRRTVLANAGQVRGPAMMDVLLDGNREGLVDRVRETRRRAAPSSDAQVPPSFNTAASALAQCQKDHVDAASPSGRPDQEIIEAALGACPDEEAATRAEVVRWLGDQSRVDHMMTELHTIAREAMSNYVRERRRH